MAEPLLKLIGTYRFEGGGSAEVRTYGDVTTEDVVWWLKELIAWKEREIATRDARAEAALREE